MRLLLALSRLPGVTLLCGYSCGAATLADYLLGGTKWPIFGGLAIAAVIVAIRRVVREARDIRDSEASEAPDIRDGDQTAFVLRWQNLPPDAANDNP
ncbi:hypothetical protein SAMN05444161_5290 [Rhizobiales bacterium GAS191]|nr:hypothetical protein SAMN05444161_5290 [Rhizobiales bacterium GAS191]